MSLEVRGYDFHCHLDLHPIPEKIIQECERNRVVAVSVTTTPKAWAQNYKWTRDSRYVHVSVGLHPELVSDRYAEINLLEDLIGNCRLIGEVGLDGGLKNKKSYLKQKERFCRILDTAQKQNTRRVISVHSRQAANDVVNLISDRTSPEQVACILHWFSGTISIAQKAVEIGCYFSVNSQMLSSKNGKSIIQKLPINRLLFETDSPFTKLEGRNTVPWDVVSTLNAVAKIRNLSNIQLQQAVEYNAKKVLGYAGLN